MYQRFQLNDSTVLEVRASNNSITSAKLTQADPLGGPGRSEVYLDKETMQALVDALQASL